MAILKGVLEAILTGKQKAAGIYLEENEDFLYLFDREEKRRGIFSTGRATIEAIRAKASEIINERR